MNRAPRWTFAHSLLAAGFVASLAAAARAQTPAWHVDFNGDIRDVFVWTDPSNSSSQRVWTCEDGSRIRYWETGASTWTFQTTDDAATQALLDLYIRDGSEGWACGMDGTILHDPDTSGTWTALDKVYDETVTPNVPAVLWGIRFTTQVDGWVCGDHVLLMTGDAGDSWDPVTLPSGVDEADTKFYALEIVPGTTLRLVVGAEIEEASSVMLYSDDGSTWELAEILDVDGFADSLPEEFDTWDVVFEPNTGSTSSSVGVMVGGVGAHDGRVYRTTNGGKTWRREATSPSTAETLYGAHAWRDGEAVACGYGGQIYKRDSTASAIVWNKIHPSGSIDPCVATSAFSAPYNGASGDDSGNLWIVGSFGALKKSTDGGTTIAQDMSDGGQRWRLNDSFLQSSTLGWVVGEVGVHRMDVGSGSTTWTTEQCTFGDTWFHGIAVKSGGEGWAVGAPHDSGDPSLWHRDTSGSWGTETSGVPSGAILNDVQILPAGGAIAVGDGGVVLRRSTSSSTWTQIAAPGASPDLYGVAVAPSGHVFLVGSGGKAFRSPSSFETLSSTTPGWIDISPSGSVSLNAVSSRSALPSLEVYACGAGGVIVKWIRSADQFQTVSGIPSPGGDYRTIALVPSSSEIWVGGTYGTMVHYNGSTWAPVNCHTSKSVHGLSFLDASHGLGLAGQNANPEGSNGDALVIGFH